MNRSRVYFAFLVLLVSLSCRGEVVEGRVTHLLEVPLIRQLFEMAREREGIQTPANQVGNLQIQFGETCFKVLEVLGSGQQGTVFHVHKGQHRALKRHKGAYAGGHLSTLAKIGELGAARTVAEQGYEIDPSGTLALYMYIHGMGYPQILKSAVLPDTIKSEVNAAQEHWVKLNAAQLQVMARDQNTLLDFDTGEFFLVDPG